MYPYFFYKVDKYKPHILSILNKQLSIINYHLQNKKKQIIINNQELNLNKRNLIYLSISKDYSPPISLYFSNNHNNINSKFNFSYTIYQSSKPFPLSIFYLIYFSFGYLNPDLLSQATYKTYLYLKKNT